MAGAGAGVYLTANGAASWRALAWAGVLIGGDDSRLGGTAAGFLHGLTAIQPDPLLVLIPHASRVQSRDHWVFQRERARARTLRAIGNPPRLLVEDTCSTCVSPGARCFGDQADHRGPREVAPRASGSALRGRARTRTGLSVGLRGAMPLRVEAYVKLCTSTMSTVPPA